MLSDFHISWVNLREDLQICFDRATDLLSHREGVIVEHSLAVFRLAERSVLKICDKMIERSLLVRSRQGGTDASV